MTIGPTGTAHRRLLPRERLILRLTAEGLTRQEIAAHPDIPVGAHAVRRILDSLRAHFGGRNLPHTIHLAHQAGVLD